jgi:hypothetical protein
MAINRYLIVLTGIVAALGAAVDAADGRCGGAALQLIQRDVRKVPTSVEQSTHIVPAPVESIAAVGDAVGAGPTNLIFNDVKYSNLGGLGPDTQRPHGIRYGNVAQLHGVGSIDAVLTSSGGYDTFVPEKNGLRGTLAEVTLKHEHTANFTLTFVNADTDAPVSLGEFFLGVLDIDMGLDGAREELRIGGFAEKNLLPSAKLTTTRLDDGRTAFVSQEHGTDSDNPADALMLTDRQAEHAVSLKFPSGLSSIHFSYTVGAKADGNEEFRGQGRSFFLAGMTVNNFCDLTPVLIEFSKTNVTRNNLGGMGPETEKPHGLIFGHIATIDGVTVDLLITNLTEYKPKNSAKNGLHDSLGIVNIHTDTQTRFQFSFVKHGTEELVRILWVYFTIYDLDMGKTGKYGEMFDMDNFVTAYLTEDSEIHQTSLGNGRYQYRSTKQGSGADNPVDLDNLNELQKNRAVTFLLHNQTGFDALFAAGPPGNSGRNFLMSGHSSVVYC